MVHPVLCRAEWAPAGRKKKKTTIQKLFTQHGNAAETAAPLRRHSKLSCSPHAGQRVETQRSNSMSAEHGTVGQELPGQLTRRNSSSESHPPAPPEPQPRGAAVVCPATTVHSSPCASQPRRA